MRTLSTLAAAVATALVLLTAGPASAATLRAPALQSPAADAAVASVPAFTWAAVRNAAAYEVQVSADRGFGSVVTGKSIVTRNTAASVEKSLANGSYYWRVRAITAGAKAGRWSAPRMLSKTWAIVPELLEPADDLSVVWPNLPLVLRWKPVPHATKYEVRIATDQSLAQPIVGGSRRPMETQGTVWALPSSLPPGRYFWTVTPIDESGFRGTPSRVGSFSWSWPSRTGVRTEDLHAHPDIVEPLASWSEVPGAGGYEVEINPSEEFAPGSAVVRQKTITNAFAPIKPLGNNSYFWRVRAIDPDGNAGEWNRGTLERRFTSRIANVRLLEAASEGLEERVMGSTVEQPVIRWDPAPGATGYTLRFSPHEGGACNLASRYAKTFVTANPAWTPGVETPRRFLATHPQPSRLQAPWLQVGAPDTWCVWIAAMSGKEVASVYERFEPAFTKGPTDGGACGSSAAPVYHEPGGGVRTATTPFLRWRHVPGHAAYWVVIARDREMTNVVDVAKVTGSAYSPPGTLRDETTAYYWAVAPSADGNCVNGSTLHLPDLPSFHKSSVAPALQAPADGAEVATQPVFRWSPAEGAASYRIQVDDDASFSSPLESVTTASTAYAAGETYPVDTELFWRVRALDLDDVELAWSRTGSFRWRLGVPTMSPDNPPGGEVIPALRWNPVPGAVSYDLHVDQADGTRKDFSISSTVFTPVGFYGTGIWRWKVRARFPSGSNRTVAGAYSSAHTYVRRINAPTRPRMLHQGGRLVFVWEPDVAATNYQLEISKDDSFTQPIERVVTPNTAYAPLLKDKRYADGGRIYWRLANADSGRNLGAWSHGYFLLPKALKVAVAGKPKPGRTVRVVLTVKDVAGRSVRRALVRVSGAGAGVKRGRTNKRGKIAFKIRARKRGTVRLTVSAKGFRTTTVRAAAK